MPTEIFNDLMSLIHLISPYERFDDADYDIDLQGWDSTSPVFKSLIGEVRPSLIIEVGTWKGASAITMAGALKAHRIASAIICVDTWLGTFDAWEKPEYRESLSLKHGYPTLYYQFLANVVKTGYSNIIIPLPSSSAVAFRWFRKVGVVADLIYIDADHDAESVYNDIRKYWQLLSPNGVLFGDDYLPEWPGVVRAVDVFLKRSVTSRRFWEENGFCGSNDPTSHPLPVMAMPGPGGVGRRRPDRRERDRRAHLRSGK